MSSTLPKPPGLTLFDCLLTFLGILAIFFLLTGGIPLVQAGLLPIAKKTVYSNWMRLAVSCFFLFLAYLQKKEPGLLSRTQVYQLGHRLYKLPLTVTVTFAFVLFSTLMTVNGFIRQDVLATRAFDLGIFSQAVWTTLHGKFLFSSLKDNICLLGDHASPSLALLTPFYALWQNPKNLLLLQAISSASAVFPISLIAYEKTKSKSFALILAVLYCFFYPIRSSLHEDFHPEVLFEPLIYWSFWMLDRGKNWKSFFILLPVLFAKENMAGISFALGCYAFLFKKERAFGIFLAAFSLGLFFFNVRWLIPHFSGGAFFYQGNYQHILSNPLHGIWQSLARADVLDYILGLFLPFLFLPFFHLPTLLLTFPILFQNILSTNPPMISLSFHYTSGMIPFLFISTIYAFEKLTRRHAWFRNYQSWILGALLWVGLVRSGPSEYFYIWQDLLHKTPHTELIKEKLRQIPKEASVLTHNNFIPQITNRMYIYQFDYTEQISKAQMAQKYNVDYVVWDKLHWEAGDPAKNSAELLASGYKIDFNQDGLTIFKKGTL